MKNNTTINIIKISANKFPDMTQLINQLTIIQASICEKYAYIKNMIIKGIIETNHKTKEYKNNIIFEILKWKKFLYNKNISKKVVFKKFCFFAVFNSKSDIIKALK